MTPECCCTASSSTVKIKTAEMHAKQQENGDPPEWVNVKLDVIAAY